MEKRDLMKELTELGILYVSIDESWTREDVCRLIDIIKEEDKKINEEINAKGAENI